MSRLPVVGRVAATFVIIGSLAAVPMIGVPAVSAEGQPAGCAVKPGSVSFDIYLVAGSDVRTAVKKFETSPLNTALRKSTTLQRQTQYVMSSSRSIPAGWIALENAEAAKSSIETAGRIPLVISTADSEDEVRKTLVGSGCDSSTGIGPDQLESTTSADLRKVMLEAMGLPAAAPAPKSEDLGIRPTTVKDDRVVELGLKPADDAPYRLDGVSAKVNGKEQTLSSTGLGAEAPVTFTLSPAPTTDTELTIVGIPVGLATDPVAQVTLTANLPVDPSGQAGGGASDKPTPDQPRQDDGAAAGSGSSSNLPLLAGGLLAGVALGAAVMYLAKGRSRTPGAGSFQPTPLGMSGEPSMLAPVAFPEVVRGRGSWTRFIAAEAAIDVIDPDEVQRVRPTPEGQGCSWAHGSSQLAAIGFWSERIAGKGEDAPPSLVFDQRHGIGFIAAYDGAGGAGSAPARLLPDGQTVSGAYVASRTARAATEQWFKSDPAAAAAEGSSVQLAALLHDQLQRAAAESLPQNSKIAGSLQRSLPTTLAAMTIQVGEGGVTVRSLWAGDSRVHVMTPDHGLAQISTDDAPETDALALLLNDSPMTNLICADRPFVINERTERFSSPVVLMAATDGCFGYVATPAHYEYLLLHHLQRAQSLDQWAEMLLEDFVGFTSDDASLVLTAFGFAGFDDLRSAFAPRAAFLRDEHWRPLEGLSRADDAFVGARADSWQRYRAGYEAFIAPPEAQPEPIGGIEPMTIGGSNAPG